MFSKKRVAESESRNSTDKKKKVTAVLVMRLGYFPHYLVDSAWALTACVEIRERSSAQASFPLRSGRQMTFARSHSSLFLTPFPEPLPLPCRQQ